jgi:hypothetical protein
MATLLDVLGLSTQLGNMFVRTKTQELKDINDLQLKNDAALYQAGLTQYFQDNPYNGDYDSYSNQLNNFTSKFFTDAQNTNNSPYYRQNIAQYQKMAELANQEALNKAQYQWANSQALVKMNNDRSTFLNSTMTPNEKLAAMKNSTQLYADTTGQLPEWRNQQDLQIDKAVTQKSIQNVLDNTMTVAELQKNTDAFTSQWGISFDGEDEWTKNAIAGRTKDIQDNNLKTMTGLQGEFERLITKGNIQGAIQYAKNNEGIKDNLFKGDELSGSGKNQAGRYLDWRSLQAMQDAELDKDKRAREAAKTKADKDALKAQQQEEKDILSVLRAKPEDLIHAMYTGHELPAAYDSEGNVIAYASYDTLSQVRDNYIARNRKAFEIENAGMNKALFNEKWAIEENHLLNQFEDAAKKEFPKGTENAVKLFTDYQTYLMQGTSKKPNEYYNKQVNSILKTPEEKDAYAQKCVDFFWNLIYEGVNDPVEINARMRNFVSKDIQNRIVWKGTSNSEATTIDRMAELNRQTRSPEAEDILFTDIRGNLQTNDLKGKQMEAVNRQAEYDREVISKGLGIPMEKLIPGWMNSPTEPNDKIPKGQFTVGNETYALDYDASNNQLIQKQNKSGAWETVKVINKPVKRDLSKLPPPKTNKSYAEILQAVKDGKNPYTGLDYDWTNVYSPESGVLANFNNTVRQWNIAEFLSKYGEQVMGDLERRSR